MIPFTWAYFKMHKFSGLFMLNYHPPITKPKETYTLKGSITMPHTDKQKKTQQKQRQNLRQLICNNYCIVA